MMIVALDGTKQQNERLVKPDLRTDELDFISTHNQVIIAHCKLQIAHLCKCNFLDIMFEYLTIRHSQAP